MLAIWDVEVLKSGTGLAQEGVSASALLQAWGCSSHTWYCSAHHRAVAAGVALKQQQQQQQQQQTVAVNMAV
jgi:hypothetical protein